MKLAMSDTKWQAESDARTMALYEEIMADTARKNRAIKEAKKQAKDLTQRASVMTKVAGKKK